MKILLMIATMLGAASILADELTGTWTLDIDTPRGVQHPTLVIREADAGYSGVYNSMRGPIDIDTITRDGSAFSFPMKITVPIGEIQVNYAGTISGDTMTGSVKNPRGEVPFTGRRTSP
jgi:hypothetical protein